MRKGHLGKVSDTIIKKYEGHDYIVRKYQKFMLNTKVDFD